MKLNLTTDRLILRPFEHKDIEPFHQICSDPDVMRYIGDGSVPSYDNVTQSIQRWIDHYHHYGYSLFAMLDKSDVLLGFCGLIHQNLNGEQKIELGYRLGKPYWGKGYATEAAQCVKKNAFSHLGIV